MIHQHLYRARLALIGAALATAVVVGLEFPFSMLMHQRSQISLVSSELNTLTQRNAGLKSDISALSNPSTIAEIAHEDYGLVDPGQTSYVILPAAGSAAANSLNSASIPPRDLVASPAALDPTPQKAAHAAGPSLWSRFVARLEFWR